MSGSQTAVETGRRRRLGIPSGAIVYLGFLVVVVVFAVVLRDRGFLTADNFANIARQTAMVSIMAFGMTFVLSAGEIDLSIGSIVALSRDGGGHPAARDEPRHRRRSARSRVGLAVGLVNGLLTTRLRIPSFLVTLGMLSIVVGLARITTDLEPVPVVDETFAFLFGSGIHRARAHPPRVDSRLPRRLPHPAATYALRAPGAGHRRQPIAAGYSGINTDRIKIAVLMMSAGTAAVAGMLYAGRLQGARYTLGEADLLTVIAATVIGGTSMFGGKGSIVGALVGSLLMGVLNNGLLLMGLHGVRAAGGPRRHHHRRGGPQPARGAGARPVAVRPGALARRATADRASSSGRPGIRKSFGGVDALDGVDFSLRRGEVHGLVGQNGAGKSTLVKILNGVHQPDAGSPRAGRPPSSRWPHRPMRGEPASPWSSRSSASSRR